MRAPLEHLESSTPMGAGEGAVYVLIAGALVGLGALAGYAKASFTNSKKEKERKDAELTQLRRNNRPHNQHTKRTN